MMEFKIRYAFHYDGEMGVWVDEHEIELFLTPCDSSEDPDEKYRIIISTNMLTLMGVDWRSIALNSKNIQGRLRIAIDHHGMRIFVKGEAG